MLVPELLVHLGLDPFDKVRGTSFRVRRIGGDISVELLGTATWLLCVLIGLQKSQSCVHVAVSQGQLIKRRPRAAALQAEGRGGECEGNAEDARSVQTEAHF